MGQCPQVIFLSTGSQQQNRSYECIALMQVNVPSMNLILQNQPILIYDITTKFSNFKIIAKIFFTKIINSNNNSNY
jgi:hypothetical protein